MHIYLLPGTAHDERLFYKLNLTGHEITVLPWLDHIKNETIAGYAARLKDKIDTSRPFAIVGMSLGGIIAVELSKLLKPQKTVIISSIKTKYELPFYLKLMHWLPIYKIVNMWLITKFMFVIYPFHGYMNKEEYRLFKRMIMDSDLDFVKWAWKAVFSWNNTEIPKNLLHLHGTRDYVFFMHKIKNAVPIKGGSHYMVMRKPDIISRKILDFLAA